MTQEAIPTPADEQLLDKVQKESFNFFWREANPDNGLVADNTRADSPASTASIGFALTTYPIAVERGIITREEAVACTLAVLQFFWNSPQGTAPDATGYKGFYYPFLDMETGRRAMDCELSTIDTSLLVAGALMAAQYFDREGHAEEEIRTLADALYRRVDWQWAQNGGVGVSLGWTPESGFFDVGVGVEVVSSPMSLPRQ